MSTATPLVGPVEGDDSMDRQYIPLPGGWEIQTQGKGSTYRILDRNTGRRLAIEPRPYLHETLTTMARDVHAASKIADQRIARVWALTREWDCKTRFGDNAQMQLDDCLKQLQKALQP